MRAAFRRGDEFSLRDVGVRPLAPGEIRLKVDACGICGTDLHQSPADAACEQGFGHEIAGTVLELGPGVTGLDVGQKVALDSSSPCGRCESCKNARQELCTDIKSFWGDTFGFAEEMIAPAVCANPCDGLDPEVACLAEPLGVAIDLARLADVNIDSNVLVMGPGPIGLMALAIVKRMGARRIFMSAYHEAQARVRVAREFGAHEIIDPTKTPVDEFDYGCAIDRVLVTTPPPTLEGATKLAAKGGVISFIGIGHGEGAYCRFDANAFHFKKLQLRASFASPALFTPMALRYLREGVVDGPALISHRFPLERIAEAMKQARDRAEAVKVVVLP